MNHPERHEVVIVGAGQSGLAAGAELKRRGVPAVLLDEHARVGDAWRERWDSLRLYTPSQYDALPGLRFPARRNSFPSGREIADYLESFAASTGLDVRLKTPVEAIDRVDERETDGDALGRQTPFVVSAGATAYRARSVIVASGAFRQPRIPSFAEQLDRRIVQMHGHDYRRPEQLPHGPVLVVGLGHSGSDIAYELARSGRRTHLSGRAHGQLPFPIESRRGRLVTPLIAAAEKHVLTNRTPIGRRLRRQIRSGDGGLPLIRHRLPDLLAAGVEHHPARTVGVQGGSPQLEDGTRLEVAAVVWCTGYRPDYAWIHLGVTGDDGWPIADGGISPVPGLYFLGIPFQVNAASMLVHGAGDDARRVGRHLVRYLAGAALRSGIRASRRAAAS